jgi:16S rRNA (cytidine1402-2'-O)-methyltransferase
VSGLPTDRFSFYGFLPRSSSERKKVLEEATEATHTVVFFESPHRLVKSLEAMYEIAGDRRAVICRELTKRFEQIERGRLTELMESTKTRTLKGEFCIVLEGRSRKGLQAADREDALRKALEDMRNHGDQRLGEAARRVARKHGLPRREVYQRALQQRGAGSRNRKDE